MTTIPQTVASPRGGDPRSTKPANAYLAERIDQQPDDRIDVVDRWQADLPEFDGDMAAARMACFGMGEMDGAGQSAGDQIVAVTQRFSDAGEYVFSVPMWNRGIPCKLKHDIDIITQPGLPFGFDQEAGYSGLLKDKVARVLCSAAVYAPGAPARYGADCHSSYLSRWLDFVGVPGITDVRFQPPLLTADPDGDRKAAVQRAVALAH